MDLQAKIKYSFLPFTIAKASNLASQARYYKWCITII